MALKEYNWPIYKGPVKRPGFAKSLYKDPFSIKRHAKTSVSKHAGNDFAYRLYMKHHPYTPKHAKPNYRYSADGRVRKVVPKPPKKQEMSANDIRYVNHTGPIETPPPRTLLIHKYNDRYEQEFSLKEYRDTRPTQTWFQRFRLCNYFREVLLGDLVMITVSFIIMIQEDELKKQIGMWLFLIFLILCPMLIIGVLYHQFYMIRK